MIESKRTVERSEWTLGEYKVAYDFLLNENKKIQKEKEDTIKECNMKIKIYRELINDLINNK